MLPGWRNWQTRTSQKRISKDVPVQIRSRALKQLLKFFIYFLKVLSIFVNRIFPLTMRKLFILLFISLFFVSIIDAQGRFRRGSFTRKKQPYKYEYVFSVGSSGFLGDLGGADKIGTHGFRDLNFPPSRPVFNAGLRFKLNNILSVKNNIFFGYIKGDDKLTKEPFRNTRNLNFRSPILELSSQIEFNLLKEQKGRIYKIKGARGLKSKERQVYGFLGAGAFYFNPQGKYTDGKWYNLHPLHTEGVNYSRISPLIAIGAGARFAINKYWGIGFEFGMRYTFTDYIDDVSGKYPDPKIFHGDSLALYFSNPSKKNSLEYCYPCIAEQRGNNKHKDSYLFATVNVGYKVMYRKRSRSKF